MKKLIYMFAALLCLAGCSGKGFGNRPNVSAEITISGLGDDHWTYFSFEEGATVGQSEYLNAHEDSLWAARTDWDFAICGDKLRTNSGTSGKGKGGVLQNTTQPFVLIKEAPTTGYQVDSVRIAK